MHAKKLTGAAAAVEDVAMGDDGIELVRRVVQGVGCVAE